MRRIGIIGGGASGIVAAIAAARTNVQAEITILEHKDSIGKKILATGNGRCNLTNRTLDVSCYRSEDSDFISNLLQKFDTEDAIRFFSSLGLVMKWRGTYGYPRSDQAASVVELLELELKRLGIKIRTGIHVDAIEKKKAGYLVSAGKERLVFDRVILSCGGRAAQKLGSDGSGYSLAKSLGHTMVPVVPALVQLKIKEHPFAKASGVRTDASVSVCIGGERKAKDTGELQITAYGVSGIPIFQISRYAAYGCYEKKKVSVEVDFLPELGEKETEHLFLQRRKDCADRKSGDFLTGIFPKKLIPCLLSLAKIKIHTPVEKLSDANLHTLAKVCKHTDLFVSETNGFENAQVCAGGIRTTEVCPDTMESRNLKGLYLTGELLDVDGICGGYNLQFAWATGYLAGCAAAGDRKDIKRDIKDDSN